MYCNPPGPYVQDFLGKNTGMVYHFLQQGIFLTQGTYISCIGGRVLYYGATMEESINVPQKKDNIISRNLPTLPQARNVRVWLSGQGQGGGEEGIE